ncbi:MAG TPA: helix-turn-helix transcriptional regulator [Puia sp.]|nr:helix-turn-helix transcriptional regulator [Puia sp.]
MNNPIDNVRDRMADGFVRFRECNDASELAAPKENYFTLLFIEKGTGTLTIELMDYPVSPGQVHILVPGKIYRWELDAPVKAYQLTIGKDILETFPPFFQFIFSHYNQPPILALDCLTFKKVQLECLAIEDELSSVNASMDLVNARCLLITLIISLWRSGERGEILLGSAYSIAHSFQMLVDENFREHKTVTFYAEKLCITPNYLGIICRKSFDKSALEIIQQRVLHEAKQLLHSTHKSIKEIAFEIGFPKLTYFSYFFKSKTNLTPLEYRRLFENSVKLNRI